MLQRKLDEAHASAAETKVESSGEASGDLSAAEVLRAKELFSATLEKQKAAASWLGLPPPTMVDRETFDDMIRALVAAANEDAKASGGKWAQQALPDDATLRAIFAQADADKNGGVDEGEFLRLYAQVQRSEVPGLLDGTFLSGASSFFRRGVAFFGASSSVEQQQQQQQQQQELPAPTPPVPAQEELERARNENAALRVQVRDASAEVDAMKATTSAALSEVDGLRRLNEHLTQQLHTAQSTKCFGW